MKHVPSKSVGPDERVLSTICEEADEMERFRGEGVAASPNNQDVKPWAADINSERQTIHHIMSHMHISLFSYHWNLH